MPLIKYKAPQEKINLRGKSISSEVYKQIEDYCAWANIQDIGIFIEETALHIFKSDKEYKSYVKHRSLKTELESTNV